MDHDRPGAGPIDRELIAGPGDHDRAGAPNRPRLLTVPTPLADGMTVDNAVRSETYRALFDALDEGIVFHDRTGRTVFANPSAARILGVSLGDLVRETSADRRWHATFADGRAVPANEHPSVVTRLTGRPQTDVVMRVTCPNDTTVWLSINTRPVRSPEGPDVAGVVISFTDITSRREAEARLRHSDSRLKALMHHSADIVIVVDASGVLSFVSESTRTVLGHDAEAWIGRNGFELVHPDDVGRVGEALINTASSAGGQEPLEMRVKHADGSWRTVEVLANNLLHDPAIEGIVVNVRDITELRRARDDLDANARRFEALLANLNDVVTVIDANAEMTYVSPNIGRLLGRLPEDRVGASIFDYVHPDDQAPALEMLAESLSAPGIVKRFETRVRHAAGYYQVWDVVASNHLDDPDVNGIIVNSRDVTDRVDVETALRVSERLYRNIVDTAAEGIWMIDANNITTFVNARMADMLNQTPADVIGRPFADFLATESPAVINERIARRRTGIAEQYESVLERSDGTKLWATFNTTPLRDDNNNYAGSLALVTDITERRRAEDALRRAEHEQRRQEVELERRRLDAQLARTQRLESVGRLAGGVAHDFNNLLAIILNYAIFTAKQLDPTSPIANDVAQIQRAAEQAAKLTNKLLLFGRSDEHHPAAVDINTIVNNVASLLERSIRPDARLITQLEGRPCLVFVDPGQIEQALVNLILNANDALGDSGSITITTTLHAPIDTLNGSGPSITLTISDDGAGMTREVAERAFEPFFTTKAVGAGTGLGLAIAHTVIARARGDIDIDSQLGAGTTIRITLPAHHANAPVATPSAAPIARPPGHETILVLDDDPNIRDIVRRILDDSGYAVITTDTGTAALNALREHPEIALLLTDIVMPHMTGIEVVLHARAIRPDIDIVYMTAHAHDHLTGALDDQVVVSKPFIPDQLLDALRAQLDRFRGRAATTADETPDTT